MSPSFCCWTGITVVRGLRVAVQLVAHFLILPPLSGLHLPASALALELWVLEGAIRNRDT